MGNRQPGCVADICAARECRPEVIRAPICQPGFFGSRAPSGLIVNKVNGGVPGTNSPQIRRI
jgi:hypothetical protein